MRGKVTEGMVKKGGVNNCDDDAPRPPPPKGSGGSRAKSTVEQFKELSRAIDNLCETMKEFAKAVLKSKETGKA